MIMEENKMTTGKDKYFVLHKKDLKGPTLSQNKAKREIYDRMKTFPKLKDASGFAMSVLHEQPILVMSESLSVKDQEQVKNQDTPYVVVAYFESKYYHSCYDGSSDPVPTQEVERCNREQLEATLMKIAEEGPNKLDWGIELKLIPSLEMFK